MIKNNGGYQSSGYGGVDYGTTTSAGGYQSSVDDSKSSGVSSKQYNRKTNSSKLEGVGSSSTKSNNGMQQNTPNGRSMQGIGNSGVRQRAPPGQDNWFLTVLSDMIQYLYTSFSAIGGPGNGNSFEDADVKLTPKVQDALSEFKRFVRKPYDKNDSEHELLLQRLWEVCRPKKKLDSRKSEMWKDIGFQGIDPATDCRGTGVYGLQMVIYLAENYPSQFRRMMKKCDREKNAYPFAIAALNVTMMLFELLGFGMPNTRKHFSIQAKHNFTSLLFDSHDFYESYPFKTFKHYLDDPLPIRRSRRSKKRRSTKKKSSKTTENNEESTGTVKTGLLIDFGDDSSFLTVEPSSPSLSSSKSISSIKSEDDLDDTSDNGTSVQGSDDEGGPLKFNLVFEEVFCMSFFTLHRCWFDANASYFEFPKIMASTRQSVDYYLSHKIDDLSDIMKWNKKQRP